MKRALLVVFLFSLSFVLAEQGAWNMLAANPQRTSWTPEQVPSQDYIDENCHRIGCVDMEIEWTRPIESFVNSKIQIIAANGILYLSSARGLYALDAESGDILWVYPTHMPLGHSPTVVDGVLYVGGYDKTIHAINATPDTDQLDTDTLTGLKINDQEIWKFNSQHHSEELSAGFETNPLVVEGVVYMGNRDGYMYAVDAADGELIWKYETGGPIRFSAAYKDETIYFASNDAHAYAIDINGALVWKSKKLPGAGFNSYWPVIYHDVDSGKDYVVFTNSINYVFSQGIGNGQYPQYVVKEVYGGIGTAPSLEYVGPVGEEPYRWVSGSKTVDAYKIIDYYEEYPDRREYFVLDCLTGEEYTFDSDNDGKPDFAPILRFGTHGGNRYPAVVSKNNVLYQSNNYLSDPYIPRGQVSGWKFGTQHISIPTAIVDPTDEPIGYSIGGNLLYYSEWFSNQGGLYNLEVPSNSEPMSLERTREWLLYNYDLYDRVPSIDDQWENPNFVYGYQTNNPPVPYRGRIYTNNNGVIIAWNIGVSGPDHRPVAESIETEDTHLTNISKIRMKLLSEVQKIVEAGHLRPGYHGQGLGDLGTGDLALHCLSHYFSNPAETIYILLQTLPYLPDEKYPGGSQSWKDEMRSYIQSEFSQYNPCEYVHTGWSEGGKRETFLTYPFVQDNLNSFGKMNSLWWQNIESGSFVAVKNPNSLYAAWKYAEEFDNHEDVFNQCEGALTPLPLDYTNYFNDYPHILNSYIAGYLGYCELENKVLGTDQCSVQLELDNLLNIRINSVSKDAKDWAHLDYMGSGGLHCISSARQFMNMVPEQASYMGQNDYSDMEAAVREYEMIVPYWFVAKYDSTHGEGTFQMLYDYPSIFQAKAHILQEPYEELAEYLDVPAFERGDLYYIQNLVATIEAYNRDHNTSDQTISNCTESDWSYTDSECQSDNTTTRTWTKTGWCEGGVTHPQAETVSCIYTLPECTEKDWSYEDSLCGADETLIRTWTLNAQCSGGTQHPETEIIACLRADLNNDNIVNLEDVTIIKDNFGLTAGFEADVNQDSTVNILDLVLVAKDFGSSI